MPLLSAGYPVVNVPPVVPLPTDTTAGAFKESRTFSFRALDGVNILPFTGNEFIARWGIQNLDVPARTVVEEPLPGMDGTIITDIKISSRTYVIPIFVGSNSGHLPFLRNRERMRGFFDYRSTDYKAAGGTFDLVATSILGERSLRSTYVDGMNGQWDQESSGAFWETFGLTALAVWPHWNGGEWSSSAVRQRKAGSRWLGTFPPKLAAKNILNTSTSVTVEGAVESFPRVDATGPCSSLSITVNDFVVDVPDGLADGETLFVDSDPRNLQVQFAGANDWSRLSPLTVMAPLRPGTQGLSVLMPDLSTNSSVVVSGTKWYETPW